MKQPPDHPTPRDMETLARLKVHLLASRVAYWRKWGGKHAAAIGISTSDKPEALEGFDAERRDAIPF